MRRRRIRASATSVLDPGIKCHCGNHAVWFMEIHAFDICDREKTVGQFFCAYCYEQNLQRAQEIADEQDETCETCGLRVVSLKDIVVRMCHLEGRNERAR